MSESTEHDFAEQVARVTAAFAGASNGTLEEDQRDSSRRIALELTWPELYAALDELVWDGEVSPEQVRSSLIERPDPRLVGTMIGSGSEEPDRSTTWRDEDGDLWSWSTDRDGSRGWAWEAAGRPHRNVYSWSAVQELAGAFPMVRVA